MSSICVDKAWVNSQNETAVVWLLHVESYGYSKWHFLLLLIGKFMTLKRHSEAVIRITICLRPWFSMLSHRNGGTVKVRVLFYMKEHRDAKLLGLWRPPKSGMSFFLFMWSNQSASGPDQKNALHISITQTESSIVKYIYLLHVQYNLQLAVPKKGTKVFPTEYIWLFLWFK